MTEEAMLDLEDVVDAQSPEVPESPPNSVQVMTYGGHTIWLFTAGSTYDIHRFIVLGPLLNCKFNDWIDKERFPTLEAAMKAIDTAVDANMKARENQKRIAVIDAEGNPRIVRGLKANGTALGIKTKVLFPDTPWIRHQFEIWKRALADFKKAEAELDPFKIPARRYPRRSVYPPTASEIMSLLAGLEAEIADKTAAALVKDEAKAP